MAIEYTHCEQAPSQRRYQLAHLNMDHFNSISPRRPRARVRSLVVGPILSCTTVSSATMIPGKLLSPLKAAMNLTLPTSSHILFLPRRPPAELAACTS